MNAASRYSGRSKLEGLSLHARITIGKNLKMRPQIRIERSFQQIKIENVLANQLSETQMQPVLNHSMLRISDGLIVRKIVFSDITTGWRVVLLTKSCTRADQFLQKTAMALKRPQYCEKLAFTNLIRTPLTFAVSYIFKPCWRSSAHIYPTARRLQTRPSRDTGQSSCLWRERLPMKLSKLANTLPWQSANFCVIQITRSQSLALDVVSSIVTIGSTRMYVCWEALS